MSREPTRKRQAGESGVRLGVPDYGVGVGLRVPHYRHILEQRPDVDFFEVISENFMVAGGRPLYHLDRVLESYPVIQHGVSLNIGGPEPLDREYLSRLKKLVSRVKPAWLSDHFCFCGPRGAHLHDLLPLPYTGAAVDRVVERAKRVQDFLEVRFALENTSSYMEYTASTMTEWEFVSEVVERADIGLMFDVNNVYVSSQNHGFDPYEFVRSVPHSRIVQIHMAGHTKLETHIIDTHRGPIVDPVLELYRSTIELTGPVSTLIEWDDRIPAFEVLLDEAERVRACREQALGGSEAALPARPPSSNEPKPAAAIGEWAHGGPRETAAQQ